MKKLDFIKIQNFKAFQEEECIALGGKNLLVYGNNGSGKSSVYWALYTLLQCSEKSDDEKSSYFAIYDETDSKTFQNLRNVFVNGAFDPFIEIKYKDIEETIKFSPTNLNSVDRDDIRTANLASDFINYKLLHNFYNCTHKNHINLWEVFERDIFPFLKPDSELDTFRVLLNSLKFNLPKNNTSLQGKYYKRNSWMYGAYQNKITTFNNEVNTMLGKINAQANRIYKDKFKEPGLKIHLEYCKYLTWDDDYGRKFNAPEIKLSVKYEKDGIEYTNHRPQSFLNEATLTRIALSIRLGVLFARLSNSDTKLLVLDDMLLSLDMSNRMVITKILLEDIELADFQKIILTHDKGFFDIIKSNTSRSEWSYLKISKDEKVFNSKPRIEPELSDLEKAILMYDNGEFEVCATHLRKESEMILKKILKKGIDDEFESLSTMLKHAITQIERDRYAKMKKLFHGKDLPIAKLDSDFETDINRSNAEKGQ